MFSQNNILGTFLAVCFAVILFFSGVMVGRELFGKEMVVDLVRNCQFPDGTASVDTIKVKVPSHEVFNSCPDSRARPIRNFKLGPKL